MSSAGDKKKKNVQTKMEAFHKYCRKVGLKMTPQRMAVYKALIETDQHPSAEMLHRRLKGVFPNISLDTVNRTLLTFSEIGVARLVEGSGDAKRFDGNVESHQHFKCLKCKRIIDFHYEPFDDIEVPPEIARKFEIRRKSIYFEGLCDRCRKKK